MFRRAADIREYRMEVDDEQFRRAGVFLASRPSQFVSGQVSSNDPDDQLVPCSEAGGIDVEV